MAWAGWSNVAKNPSPAVSTSRPWNRLSWRRTSAWCALTICRHRLSPTSTALSVEPTMSVNNTVVSRRWGASDRRGMAVVSAPGRAQARARPKRALPDRLALRLEGLEGVAAGPAEVRAPAQRGAERALQDGIRAAAEGTGRHVGSPRQRRQGQEHRPLPGRSEAVPPHRLPALRGDPVAGPRGRVDEPDHHGSIAGDALHRSLDVVPDDVQRGAAGERREQVDLHRAVPDSDPIDDPEIGDRDGGNLRIVDRRQRLPH